MVEGSPTPFGTALSYVARTNSTGREIEDKADVKTPYELRFTSKYKGKFSDEKEYDKEGN